MVLVRYLPKNTAVICTVQRYVLCRPCLTSQGQAIRCLAKCSCRATSGFICYLLMMYFAHRWERNLKSVRFPDTKYRERRFFQALFLRRPCYLNINLTSGCHTAYFPAKIYDTVLRDPEHHCFAELKQNLSSSDFHLLKLADL